MRNLIVFLFAIILVFACSEEAEEMMEDAGEVAEEAMDKAGEMAEEAMDKTEEMAADSTSGPQVEPLPDWDSLPPIEEVAASEDGSTMMEKAEEKVEEVTEKAKEMAEDKAGEMMNKE